MAYTPTFSQFTGMQPQIMQPMYTQRQPQTQPGINNLVAAYVLGEQDAKAYPVAPSCMAILIDMEKPVIYTKSVDQFGRPVQFKILEYVEKPQNDPMNNVNTQNKVSADNYVTKDDLNNFKNEIKEMLRSNNSSKPNNYKKPAREDVNA